MIKGTKSRRPGGIVRCGARPPARAPAVTDQVKSGVRDAVLTLRTGRLNSTALRVLLMRIAVNKQRCPGVSYRGLMNSLVESRNPQWSPATVRQQPLIE